ELRVCHLPPGTSKWNKIEHRLFSYITQNWRGKPLVSYAAIVSLIAATTTRSGLTVHCELDTDTYPTGRKVTDAEFASINLKRDTFHGQWNYRIRPRSRPYETLIS
ncbi:MAG: ISAzo13 family transposase, partial [Chloroflexi bacterium]|nr:ISAzo13 family transposase [Chloroflexota bacterium]